MNCISQVTNVSCGDSRHAADVAHKLTSHDIAMKIETIRAGGYSRGEDILPDTTITSHVNMEFIS